MTNMFLSILFLLMLNEGCYGKLEKPCSLKEYLIKQIERDLVELKSLHVYTHPYNGHQADTYIRWGRTKCPQGATLVYDGYAAGNHYSISGSGSNYLCLPKNPDWKEYTSGENYGTGKIYRVEYEVFSHKPYPKSFHNQNTPCAVCLTPRSTVLMIPGKITCHEGWHKEFSGYLMSNMSKVRGSEYICVDEKLETVPGGKASHDHSLVFPVEAVCGTLQCPPYVDGREITCIVCSK